ncbi:TPA: hypothetical protein ACGFA2_001908 [Serratia marcescens]|uniref:hypothetical protein n=1 Tax=Serratia TaxID=613 RepID=UPI002DB79166|nr:hypothetical protein [Serratia marcescens]MEB7509159.1 hypothetical protein [Serratia marcescens]
MDADLISYESMLATRESADWAFWNMVATWGTLAVSTATLVLACLALQSWKRQEELKVKQAFKASLIQLRNLLIYMPYKIDTEMLRIGREILKGKLKLFGSGLTDAEFARLKDYAQEFLYLEEGMKNCWDCWVSTENLLNGTEISQLWMKIHKVHNEYVEGVGSKDEVIKNIISMLEKKFVF